MSNPKIVFGNDQKHVIYRNGSTGDNLILQVNDHNVVNVTNLQNQDNILLGTTSPTLHVQDINDTPSSAEPRIKLSNTNEDWEIKLGVTGASSDFAFHIANNGDNKINVLKSGYVGLGTDNPVRQLHLTEDVFIEGGDLLLTNVNNSINSDGTDIMVNVGGSEVIRFQNGGNVGIGTNNPLQKLDVNGDVSLRGSTVYLHPYESTLQSNAVTFPEDIGVSKKAYINDLITNTLTTLSSVTFTTPITFESDVGISGIAYINDLDSKNATIQTASINNLTTDVTTTHHLGVSGDADIKNLYAHAPATFYTDIGVSENAYIKNLEATDGQFFNSLGVSGDLNVFNLTVSGESNLSNINVDSFIVPEVVVTDTLGVSNVALMANAVVDGFLDAGDTVIQTLGVSGDSYLYHLNVFGDTNVQSINIAQQLGVSGLTTFYDDVTFLKNTTVAGTSNLSNLEVVGDANLYLNLNVTGQSNLGLVDINGVLDAYNDARFHDDIGVSKVAYINHVQANKIGVGVTDPQKDIDVKNGILIRDGDLCFQDSTYNIGITNNRLAFSTNSTSRLYIEQDGSVVVGVTYPTDTAENFYVDGSAKFEGDLTVRGNISLEGSMINIGVSTAPNEGIRIGSGLTTIHIPGDMHVGGGLFFDDGHSIGFLDTNTADNKDWSIYGKYNDGTDKFAGLGRNATYGNFAVFTDNPNRPDNDYIFNPGDAEWTLANFSANRIGINTNSPSVSLGISGTDAILLPVGNTSERPTAQDGLLRYNSQLQTFEGYSNSSWGPIGGGAADLDGDTYIRAETSVGADNDELEFFTAGNKAMQIEKTADVTIYNDLGVSGNTYLDNVGIGVTTNPRFSLEFNKNDAILLPRGTTAERPAPYENGLMRYNTDQSRFEGFSNGNWSGIGGGAVDLDQDTYISAENNPGADNDQLKFFTDGVERMRIEKTAEVTIYDDLGVSGTTYLKDLGIGVTQPVIYPIEIRESSAILLPVGNNAERPSAPEHGLIRYNLEQSTFEGYSSGAWGSLGGVKDVDGDTEIKAEDNPGDDNDQLKFYTAGVQHMLIDNTGDVTINKDLGVSGNIYLDNVGIGITQPPRYSLEFNKNDAILLPRGTTAERPSPYENGLMRYNTEQGRFEGFSNGNWSGIGGGAVDLDQDTYISAENNPGADNDQLKFFTDGVERMRVEKTGEITIYDDLGVSSNTYLNQTTTADLTVNNNALINNNITIINDATINNNLTVQNDLGVSGTTYLKDLGIGVTQPVIYPIEIRESSAILLPVGNNAERPVAPEHGLIRYNLEQSTFEGYSSGAWGSLGGVKDIDGDTEIKAEDNPGDDNDQLKFYTAGTEHMRIENDGQVVIGITSFTDNGERLVVDGDVKINGNLKVAGGDCVGINAGVSGSIMIGTSYPEQTIQIGADEVTLYVPSDLVVDGNVFYNSNFIQVHRNNVDNTEDSGWYTQFVDNGVTYYSGIAWDASSSKWGVFKQTDPPGDTIVKNGDWDLGALCIGDLGVTGTATISGTANISGTVNVGGSFNITTDTTITGTGGLSLQTTDTVTGIEIGTSSSTTPITFGGDVVFKNNIYSENNFIGLQKGINNNTEDSGFYTTYFDGTTKYTGLIRDNTNGQWNIFDNFSGSIGDTQIAYTEYGDLNVKELGVSGHIIPTINEEFDLGTPSLKFRDLYLSGSSIKLGTLTMTDNAGVLEVPQISTTGGDFTITGGDLYIDDTKSIISSNNKLMIGGTDGMTVNTQQSIASTHIYNIFDGSNNGTGEFRITKGTATTSDGDTAFDTNPFFMINNSGNVGIGTNNPVYRSHLYQSSNNINTLLYLQNSTTGTSAGSRMYIKSDTANALFDVYSSTFTTSGSDIADSLRIQIWGTGGLSLEAKAAAPIRFYTNATERMRILSGGNVGIGTNNPLTVGTQKVLNIYDSTGSGCRTQYQTSTTGTTDSDGFWIGIGNSGEAFLTQRENTYIRFDTNDTERMRILSGGNVGIGTTNPDYPFHAFTSSTNNVAKFETTAASSAAFVRLNTERGNFGNLGVLEFSESDNVKASITAYWQSVAEDDSRLFFNTIGDDGLATRMTITEDGFVGIGTDNPSTKLDVNGQIRARSGLDCFTDSSIINFAGNTRKAIGAIYNDATGDVYGLEQVSSAQSNTSTPETRIFTAGNGTAGIGFGKYTSSTAFTDFMTLTSGGDVGIGTTNPTGFSGNKTLHIHSSDTNGCNVHFTKSDIGQTNNDGSYIGIIDSGELMIDQVEANDIVFRTNSFTERMRIESGGDVGIGTNNPAQRLHVREDNATGMTLQVANYNSTTGNYRQLLFTGYRDVNVNHPAAAIRAIQSNSDTGFSKNSQLTFWTESGSGGTYGTEGVTFTEKMRITNGGNVGIGTNSPGQKLEVNSGNIFINNSTARLYLVDTNEYIESDGTDLRMVAGANEGLRIKGATGNVGINTNVAGSTLTVNGSVSKTSGSFLIDHPDPVKKAQGMKLKHCFVESPTAGDNIYTFECEAMQDGQIVEIPLPDYYKYLNENTRIWINGIEHFGRAYGKISEDETKLLVTCEKVGKYQILCIGTRKDPDATEHFATGVEFIE